MSDRYPVNQPRLFNERRYRVSSEFNSEEYIERNKRRYEGFKRMGMHLMPMMGEEKGGSRASDISTESGIGLSLTRLGTREVHTRLIKGNNLGNRNVIKS